MSEILNRRAREENLNIHVEVLNYGRGFYYPSQETVLLIDLLKNGHRPSLILFLDGVSWKGDWDVPEFYEQARRKFRNLQFVDQSSHDQMWTDALRWVPMVRLARSLGHKLFGSKHLSVAQRASEDDPSFVHYVVNGFRQNRMISEAVCSSYSVRPVFFLEPNPVYNYPVNLYRRPLPEEFFSWRNKAHEGYQRLSSDPGLIDLSGLFKLWGTERKAIIDELHYSPPFSHFLAEHISAHIHLNALEPRVHTIDESAVTGKPREADPLVTKR